MSTVKVALRGGKEAHKLMNSLSGKDLQNRTRRGVRKGAAVGRQTMRSMARDPKYPSAYTAGVAGGGIATRNHRFPIATSVGPTTPLLNLFEPGATAHQVGATGQVLRGAGGQDYRSAPFMARGPVRHPGFPAVPLIGPVFEKEKDHMAEAAMDVLLEGLK